MIGVVTLDVSPTFFHFTLQLRSSYAEMIARQAFGRPVRNMKKFEEGVFSDLRNLRPGVDACLEEPKSGFLDLLFKYQCIRTQKKQKVFYWFSVPHDRLFLDALDRDLKREKMGQEPTTVVAGEPALSFTYDPKRPLYEQFSKMLGARDGESEYDRNLRHAVNNRRNSSVTDGEDSSMDGHYTADESDSQSDLEGDSRRRKQLFGYPLFPGSSTYKERRRNAANAKRAHRQDSEGPGDEHRGRSEGPGQSGSRHGSASASRERPRNPNPRYDSMMDEFGPGSMDERQQSEPVLSAADFFLKQAKGQLLPPNGIARKAKVHQPIGEVDVYYSEGAPPPPASDSSSSSADHSTHPMDVFQHSRSMSVDGTTAPSHHHRRSYHGNPSASFPDDFGFGASASQSNPIAAPVPSQPRSNIPQQAPVSSTAMYEQHGPDGKIKAFVCPLFSCGRLFKRMEHLKRHLRTHTMERPFACNKCNKKFSRSDNLNQHLRTHERTTGGAVPSSPNPDGSAGEGSGGGGAGEYTMDDESEQEDDRAFGNNNGGHGSGGESDDELLARYGGSDGQVYGDGSMNLSNLDLSNFAPPGTYSTEIPMREIEARDVQEVQGDEEGLLAIANAGYAGQPQDNYYTHSSTLFQSNSGGAAADPQWSRLSGSGFNSFGNLSNPNPLQTRGNRSSMGSIPGHYMQTMGHTSNPSITSLHSEDLSTSSLSAPSSKAVFDHHTMYGANVILDDVTSTAGGPIRRHRSMTPSFTRSGEPIRRPPTSNGGDFNSSLPGGAPSSVGSNSGASGHRGYHPYASGYASSSRSNSTHSSPALHNNMPLGGEYTQMRSRNSSFSLGAAPNMVGSDVAMAPPEAASAAFGDAMYRTDSPAFLAQTESPAPYTIDLPNHYLAPGYHFTNQAQGQSSSLPTQFSTEQQSHGGEAYYPQHVPTI
ncbi:STE-domain-containing protein [Coprinopsis marcescibilis]|uniref:STE-domain-containing protein n=1 Tax=Coprinopsis marcescibilis TaxID=230819 RepID=A0A5C3LES2_COPMA|nr:STE-domain-containing protein [Coprinopsis marcescibilis]